MDWPTRVQISEAEKPNLYGAIGAFLAALAVVLGAFGAHLLEEQLTPNRMKAFETAVLYHLVHAVGLILVSRMGPHVRRLAAPLLLAGIVLFSGSLYVLTMTGLGALGAVTPLGGICFILGWGAVGTALLRGRRK